MTSNLPQNERREFVIRNDSFEIRYDFESEPSAIRVSIYNKLDLPLFVDWKSSAIIHNGVPHTYWTDVSYVDLQTVEYPSTIQPITYGSASGTLYRPAHIGFIPPDSYVVKENNRLNTGFFDKNIQDAANGKVVEKNSKFDTGNSPLRFRSFLTLAVTEDFRSAFHADSEFWISEVNQDVTLRPGRADMIVHESTPGADFLAVVFVSAVAVPLAILYASEKP